MSDKRYDDNYICLVDNEWYDCECEKIDGKYYYIKENGEKIEVENVSSLTVKKHPLFPEDELKTVVGKGVFDDSSGKYTWIKYNESQGGMRKRRSKKSKKSRKSRKSYKLKKKNVRRRKTVKRRKNIK